MGLEIIFMGLLLGWDSWTTFRWIPGVKSHGQWALGWLWFVVISSCVCVGAWFFGLYPFFLSNILMGSKMYKRWLQQIVWEERVQISPILDSWCSSASDGILSDYVVYYIWRKTVCKFSIKGKLIKIYCESFKTKKTSKWKGKKFCKPFFVGDRVWVVGWQLSSILNCCCIFMHWVEQLEYDRNCM